MAEKYFGPLLCRHVRAVVLTRCQARSVVPFIDIVKFSPGSHCTRRVQGTRAAGVERWCLVTLIFLSGQNDTKYIYQNLSNLSLEPTKIGNFQQEPAGFLDPPGRWRRSERSLYGLGGAVPHPVGGGTSKLESPLTLQDDEAFVRSIEQCLKDDGSAKNRGGDALLSLLSSRCRSVTSCGMTTSDGHVDLSAAERKMQSLGWDDGMMGWSSDPWSANA